MKNDNLCSITYHKASQRFMGRITLGRDLSGKIIRKTVYGLTKEEVKEKVIKLQAELYNDTFIEPSRMLLKQWLVQWFNTYKISTIKPQTKELYKIIIDTIIIPQIGDNKLKELKPIHIQAFINKLYNFGDGYATSTLQKVKNILNPAFKSAITNKMIVHNPCEGLQLPRSKAKEVIAFSREEQLRFESIAINHNFGEAFIFCLDTGLRCGELLALSWDDIDFKKCQVKVHKTLISVKDNKTKKLKLEVQNTPKTQSANRIIPLTDRCINLLKELKKKRLQKGFNDNNIVFCSSAGTHIYPKNFRRAMNNICTKAKICKSGIHVLRHSFATRLFEEKVPVKIVSQLLGHSKIEVTLNTYVHLTQENTVDAIQVLNNINLHQNTAI